MEKLSAEEGSSTAGTAASKLRARNATLASDVDPKYRGKKVSRKSLEIQDDSDLDENVDPELAKMCMIEASESESENDEFVIERPDDISVNGDDDIEEDEDDDDDDDLSEEEEMSENKQYDESEGEEEKENFDFSQFADDDDEQEERSEDDSGLEGDEVGIGGPRPGLKKLVNEEDDLEFQKAKSIDNQTSLFDSLFALRISLQKTVLGAQRLPQPDTYDSFSEQKDHNYLNNLKKAKKQSKKLISSLIKIQDFVLKKNKDTKWIVSGKKRKSEDLDEDDEEITSSEDDDEDEIGHEDKKAKLSIKEIEEHLDKRFTALMPYRDSVYTK